MFRYRPISILPITSLILERHVNYRPISILPITSLNYWLKRYLETIHFYIKQSGFREHHSCQTALIKIIDDWLTAIDKNMFSGSLFLDLSKAFHLVNDKLLICR